MKIAIVGTTGMLGYAMSKYLQQKHIQVIEVSRDNYNIAKGPMGHLEEIIREADVVINGAGIVKPLIPNYPIEEVLKINSIFPRNLSILCQKNGKKMFHITTDCVYSGKKGNYSEEDYFDAEDVYGLSKNAGEVPTCMVLRTSFIGEEKGQVRNLLEWARSQKGKAVNGFTNHIWNGVTTLHLSQVILEILNKNLYRPGLFHIHSPDRVNKFELLQYLDLVYALELKISATDTPEKCDRSLATIHELTKIVATKPILKQIQEMRDFFNT
ncbi:MAG: hypothetical protein A2X86_18455 [Bdellovibrionales bacterium GWA2_49_15]|nr:MAG: hypothetical protein A2X86_18455 [Bdellovibrionales bacterium GWA2_49_15]HAZ11707.1 NAD-dependent dehydratase [Bdellovibrionales bacterium]